MEQDTITEDQLKRHKRISELFDDVKRLSKVDTEQARQLMMVALSLMKAEFNKLKRR